MDELAVVSTRTIHCDHNHTPSHAQLQGDNINILTFIFPEDFDECASSNTNNCAQVCVNLEGSYMCDCQSGFLLNTDDGRTCTGKIITHQFYSYTITTPQ